MIHKYKVPLVIVALSIILIVVIQFLFWSFQSEDVLVVDKKPIPAESIQTTSGRFVILDVDYCKKYDIDGKLRISFISKTREVFLPLSDERGPVICNNAKYPVPIPVELIPDEYKIKFHVIYDINPIKKGVAIDFESKTFKVN